MHQPVQPIRARLPIHMLIHELKLYNETNRDCNLRGQNSIIIVYEVQPRFYMGSAIHYMGGFGNSVEAEPEVEGSPMASLGSPQDCFSQFQIRLVYYFDKMDLQFMAVHQHSQRMVYVMSNPPDGVLVHQGVAIMLWEQLIQVGDFLITS